MKNQVKGVRSLFSLTLVLALFAASLAFAAPLDVKVQPSGDSFAKAYVITGESRTYFGRVEGGTGPYEYRWEFSNGGNTAFASVSDPRYISFDGKVFDTAATHWARLTVRDSASPQATASATIILQVMAAGDDNLTRKKNSAIDRGLRYLYQQEQVSSTGSSWPGSGAPIGSTGMALIALENHGHNLQSPDSDIYKKSVQQGILYLLNNAYYFTLSDQMCIGNPEANDGDSDNDGKGIHWNDDMYQNPIAMLAIINSCDKTTAQSLSFATTTGDVNGQTLWNVIVDAKDYLAWAQNDAGGGATAVAFSQSSSYGIYGYAYVSGASVTNINGYLSLPDFSTLGMGGTFTINWGDGATSTYVDKQYYNYGSYGYPELNYGNTDALFHTYASSGSYTITVTYTSNGNTVQIMEATVSVTAGGTGCTYADAATGAGGWRYGPNYGSSDNSVTQWPVLALAEASKRWNIEVNPLVKTMLDYWLQYSQNADGGFGYTAPTDWVNFPKTGAGTIMLNYLGLPAGDSRVTNAFSYLNNNWTSENYNNTWNASYMYSMYAFYKGMKGWGTTNFFGRDWEALYTENLVQTQQASNVWYDAGGWEDANFATYSALAILAPEVASLPPVANAGGPYPTINPNQNITLNGGASYHQDPAKHIVGYEWDFNAADGLWWDTKANPAAGEGARGMTATASYPDTGSAATYTATLRVTDDTPGTPLTDTATATINVATGNVAPVAVTNGPWSGTPGQVIVFDGSGSYDPNSCTTPTDPKCLGDSIVSYEWDLDGDGIFNEPGDDGTPTVPGNYSKVQKSFANPGSLQATLRVTDEHGLTSTSTAQFNIVSIALVFGQQYESCYRIALNRFQDKLGIRVKFKNLGTAAADNVIMTLKQTPTNLTILKATANLGTMATNVDVFTRCDATTKTADIELLADKRIIPSGTWRWLADFDLFGSHYTVDNIPALP